MKQIKTIDVDCLEWFDKVNGNSYFAGTITVNFGLPNEFKLFMPFQYGYGNHYEHTAFKELQKAGYFKDIPENEVFWRVYQENGIIYRHQKVDRCKKRELKAIDKVYYK